MNDARTSASVAWTEAKASHPAPAGLTGRPDFRRWRLPFDSR